MTRVFSQGIGLIAGAKACSSLYFGLVTGGDSHPLG